MSEQRPDIAEHAFPEGSRVAVVASRWNGSVVDKLLDGCLQRLDALGAASETFRVPGAFELPTAARWLAETGKFDSVILLGCVIRGQTPHFDLVAGECARGTMRISLDMGVPVIFGVLTVNTREQADARAGGEHGHAGVAAADAAGEMVLLRRQVTKPASS